MVSKEINDDSLSVYGCIDATGHMGKSTKHASTSCKFAYKTTVN